MKIMTKRFGAIEIDESTIITFPNGILGFPKNKKYSLLDTNANSPLKWLQSVETPELAFVVTDPLTFYPEYEIKARVSDLEDIELSDPTRSMQFVIVTVPRNPADMTANFKGPLVINTENFMGKQLVLEDSDYEIKRRLLPKRRQVANGQYKS